MQILVLLLFCIGHLQTRSNVLNKKCLYLCDLGVYRNGTFWLELCCIGPVFSYIQIWCEVLITFFRIQQRGGRKKNRYPPGRGRIPSTCTKHQLTTSKRYVHHVQETFSVCNTKTFIKKFIILSLSYLRLCIFSPLLIHRLK